MLCSKKRLLSRVSSRHPVGNSRSMRIDVTIHALLVPSWSTSSQNFSVGKGRTLCERGGNLFRCKRFWAAKAWFWGGFGTLALNGWTLRANVNKVIWEPQLICQRPSPKRPCGPVADDSLHCSPWWPVSNAPCRKGD